MPLAMAARVRSPPAFSAKNAAAVSAIICCCSSSAKAISGAPDLAGRHAFGEQPIHRFAHLARRPPRAFVDERPFAPAVFEHDLAALELEHAAGHLRALRTAEPDDRRRD